MTNNIVNFVVFGANIAKINKGDRMPDTKDGDVPTKVPFEQRLKEINRRHQKMANGSVRLVKPDGLIVVRPRAFRARFPLKSLIAVLLIGFCFKGFLFAFLGQDAYAERVASLQAGSAAERAGAWIMQPDPATLFIADGLGALMSQ